MRPSGLEPPPGKPRTRPSTLYRKCRYVHEHPDRPYRQLFWKHWKHWTIWTLPKCCHECESPTLRCDIPRLPLRGSAFARKEQRLKTRPAWLPQRSRTRSQARDVQASACRPKRAPAERRAESTAFTRERSHSLTAKTRLLPFPRRSLATASTLTRLLRHTTHQVCFITMKGNVNNGRAAERSDQDGEPTFPV
jgi:hypothetical protein